MIRLIEVKGYKCLRHIHQPLQRFCILAGPNASGKSTFLDVILFVRDLVERDVEWAVRSRAKMLQELVWKAEGSDFEIALEFELPENLQRQRNGYTCKAARYEIRVGRGENEELQILAENLWLISESAKRKRLPSQGSCTPEIIATTSGRRSPNGYRRVASRLQDGRIYICSERTGWSILLRPLPGRSALTVIPEDEDRFPVSIWLRRLLGNIQPLALNGHSMQKPAPPDTPRTLQPDGANLTRVLEALREENPERFEHWLYYLKTILTGLKSLETAELPENRFRYILAEFADGTRLPSWLISDGLLSVMTLTLLPYLSTPDAIYLIERPESGVHPAMLEAIYQSLSSVYDGQILCISYSPILLNLARPEQLLYFVQAEGATNIILGGFPD